MKKSKLTNEARKAVYRRDGFQCAVCGDNRRLQIHHIWKRSQGGGDEQMNLITLCSVCHALAHGINLAGVDLTQEDVEQSVVEYMSDLYADLGFRWPDGEPLDKMPAGWYAVMEEWDRPSIDEPAGFDQAIDEWLDSFLDHPLEKIEDMIDGITPQKGRRPGA